MELATVRDPAQARASQTLEEAFPEVNPLCAALGNQVLVQMRRAKQRTAGGVILVNESKDMDESMIRVARVLELGPIAYKNRDSFAPWPEGAWVKVGDYVRVPSYAGVDSWRIFLKNEKCIIRGEEREFPAYVKFALFNDYDIKARIKGDPLAVVDYV